MSFFAALAADSYGNASSTAAPLVLLHGLTFDRTHWAPAMAELAKLDPDRRAVAFDLPGHGDSPRRDSYSLTEVAPLLHDAITEAGLTEPIIVGHSLGGALATHYTANYPVRAAVNVDQPLRVAGFAALLRGAESRLRGPEWSDFWATMLGGMHIDLLPPSARELVESAKPRQDQLLGYWHELLVTDPDELDQLRKNELAAIGAGATPYHYVTGAAPDPSYQDWLTAQLPEVQVTVLADTGHFPHLGKPAEFARLLNSVR